MMLVCIILVGCSDDFDKFNRKVFEISSNINGNIYIIDEIHNELNDIIAKYSDNLTLTYAEYTFKNECKGDAMFHYKREYNDKGREFLETIDLYVDANGQAYKIVYTDGRINRVNDYPSNDIFNKETNILEIIKENEESFINDNDNSYIKVILDENGIVIKYFKNNSLVTGGDVYYGYPSSSLTGAPGSTITIPPQFPT